MYEYLKGKLTEIYNDQVVVECYGIGYSVNISINTFTSMGSLDDEIKLYVHEHIREDEMTLYGFYDKSEREVFRNLISISGIGPRVSLGILSKFKVSQLLQYIATGDEKALSSVPGIGKKTANRIILELKDKFKNTTYKSVETSMELEYQESSQRSEAIDALVSLGYTYNDALEMIEGVYKPEMSLQELIKSALSKAAI